MIFLLIAINTFIFLLWLISISKENIAFMREHFLVSWSALADGRWWTIFTSVFSHHMFLHFLINMMVLKSFGPVLVRILSRRSFLAFYLVAGAVASLSHAFVSAFILGDRSLPALGASGAIAGLVMVFSLIFPREKILLFGFVPIPALWGALAFIGLDLWGVMAQAKGGGLPIGHGAHLGGAFTGAVYFYWLLRPRIKQRTGKESARPTT